MSFCRNALIAALSFAVLATAADAAAARGAKGKGKRAARGQQRPEPPPPPPASEPPSAEAPARATPAIPADVPAAELLARAQALYADLEYQQVLPLAQACLAREGLSPEQRLDAYLILGSSEAIVGNPFEAEKAFRLLLRARPDFAIPGDAPPKITRVFRNVKVEEDRIHAETVALERKRLIESLSLEGGPPARVLGGDPIAFSYALHDPRGAVRSVRVQYRKQGASSDFASLPLAVDGSARWYGAIPGAWTESDSGFVLEYRVETIDEAGAPLLGLATARVDVGPGTLAEREPFYGKVWFWSAAAAVVVGGGVAAFFAVREATKIPEGDTAAVEF